MVVRVSLMLGKFLTPYNFFLASRLIYFKIEEFKYTQKNLNTTKEKDLLALLPDEGDEQRKLM